MGIYRNVWLVKAGPVHVTPWGTQVTSEVDGQKATVIAKTTLRNESQKAQNLRLVSTILDANGKSVATNETRLTLEPGQEQIATAQHPVENPRVWSLQDPYRYTLVSQIMQGDDVLDRYTTPFGIRTIKWDAKQGFLLNGVRVPLHGVCLHHDLGALGAAINVRALQRQLKSCKKWAATPFVPATTRPHQSF